MAVFDWYVLLPILANFKEYWINVTKSRMHLSLSFFFNHVKRLGLILIIKQTILLSFTFYMFQGVRFGGCWSHSLCLLGALLASQLSGNHLYCLVNMKGGRNNKNSHLNSCIRICQWNAAHRTIEVRWNWETLLDVMCREPTASRNIYVVLLWGPNETALANST